MDETTLLEVVRGSCNQMILLLEMAIKEESYTIRAFKAPPNWKDVTLDTIKRVRARLQLVDTARPTQFEAGELIKLASGVTATFVSYELNPSYCGVLLADIYRVVETHSIRKV